MILSELSSADLVELLRNPGLYVASGPFVVHLESRLSQVAAGMQELYQDFSLENVGFADFHVKLDKPCNLHRWFRPQVVCYLNDESSFAPLPIEQAFAMFESCLNWAIYSGIYSYMIIHGAAVERNGFAAILTAPPGSGKSTLCAALVNRGWRLLTDELTLVCPKTETILPLARPISLKNESIDVLRRFAPESTLGPEIHNTIKGTIAHMRPSTESVLRMHEAAAPGWMIFPKYEPGSKTTSRPLPKAQTFMRIPAGLVNYPVLGELGFRLLTNLIDRMDCYEFTYSELEEAIAWFDQLTPPQWYVDDDLRSFPSVPAVPPR